MDNDNGQSVAKQVPGLDRRNGIYHFRKAVPTALRPVLNKPELSLTLDTSDRPEALIRHAACLSWALEVFRAAEDGTMIPPQPNFGVTGKAGRKPKPLAKKDDPSIGSAFAAFRRTKDPSTFGASAEQKFETARDILFELRPESTPISKITNNDLLDARDAIRQLPTHYRKKPQTRGKPLKAVITIGQKLKLPLLDAGTINEYTSVYVGVWKYADRQGWARGAVADGLRLRKKKSVEQSDPFSDDELAVIVSRCRELPEDRRWVLLIALFTGARLNEICSLWREDVIRNPRNHINYIYFCRREAGKTDAARRQFPVPFELRELRFLDWIDGKTGHLFPTFKKASGRGTYSGPASKFYSRWFKSVGIHDAQRKVFHSLRHNWTDAALDCQLDPVHREYLIGHAPGGSYGGTDRELDTLAKEVAKIRFRVDLSPLGISYPADRSEPQQSLNVEPSLPVTEEPNLLGIEVPPTSRPADAPNYDYLDTAKLFDVHDLGPSLRALHQKRDEGDA